MAIGMTRGAHSFQRPLLLVALGLLLVASTNVGTTLFLATPTYGLTPATMADDCSSDVTGALNAFFAHAPVHSTISLPERACYLVSNSATTLTLQSLSDLTIEGNGATFKQTHYACGSNTRQPILNLKGDTNISFDDLTIEGPGSCGGAGNEGDYGVLLGQSTPGNTNITFDRSTIENTDGDGLAVYPQLGTCCGVNKAIAFKNGVMAHIGYHTITPEGVVGLYIAGNTFVNDGNFMDLEVDNDGPGNATTPIGVAQWNITVTHNVFTAGSALGFNSEEGSCIPQKNLSITNNTVTTSGFGMSMVLGGSGSASCGRDSGLTIANNRVLSPARSPCGGSVAWPPGCSIIEVADYQNVLITGNRFDVNDGLPYYFPNTIWVPCITLQGVSVATIQNNACVNAWDIWDTTHWQFQATEFPPTTNVAACGNSSGLIDPVVPITASVPPPSTPSLDARCSPPAISRS